MWFARKRNNAINAVPPVSEVETLKTPASVPEYDSEVLWTRTISLQSLIDSTDRWMEQASRIAVLRSNQGSGRYQYSFIPRVGALKDTVLRVDRGALTPAQARNFARQVKTIIPQLLIYLGVAVYEEGDYSEKKVSVDSSLTLSTETLSKMPSTLDGSSYSPPSGQSAPFSHPLTQESLNTLKTAENLLLVISGQVSPEDEFFVRQVVYEYLPEIWQTLAVSGESPSQSVAEQLVSSIRLQLQLLDVKMSEIRAFIDSASVRRMDAQLALLHAKTADTAENI